MPDVFLSYSREDQPVARRFAEALQREGFSVWWDQALNAGEAFDRVTEKALDEARAVVVLWSRASVDSNWVRAEATQAHANQRLVPVTIEPCKRPIMFELTHTADLSGWSGDAGDPRWRNFVEGLRRFAGGSATPAAAAGAMPAATSAAGLSSAARHWRIGWLAGAVAAIAVAGGLLWSLHGRQAPVGAASIAVLPFDDLSPQKDQQYFADGVAEEILNKLARIPDSNLLVTARNSSFAFRGQNRDLRTIGQTLGVAHLLEGSLRKAGDQLRITAQLIRADTGFHLWSQTYERPLTDVFAIQEDIATKVAEALQVKLGVGLGQQPGMTRNVDAYEAFLAASALPQEFTVDGEQRRIELLQRAVNLDPDFAQAWLAMASSYGSAIGILGPAGAQEWTQKSEAAFQQYERILPDSPVRHWRLANLSIEQGRWTEAAGHSRAAAEAAVRIGVPQGLFANGDPFFRLRVGHPRDAVADLERLRASDPLSQGLSFALAWSYGSAGDFQAAFREFERGDTLAPTERFRLRSAAALLAFGTGDRAQLLRWLDATAVAESEIQGLPGIYGRIRALLDRPDEALAYLHAEVGKASPLAKAGFATVMAGFGDYEGALEALRQGGLQPGSMGVTTFTLWTPALREVRKLEGFKQLMRDAGLVDYWKEYGWGDFCKPTTGDDFECS